ncbi:hypothetical protein NQ315_014277, partial [Exocentrus adspersus]
MEELFDSVGKSPIMEEVYNTTISGIDVCCVETYNSLIPCDNNLKVCIETEKNRDAWQKQRQYRITGSRCYSIFTYGKNDWHKKAYDYFWPKTFTNKYVRHGIEHEKNAKMCYSKTNNIYILETGLIIDPKNAWLGYSPDGIVVSENALIKLLEIKCPYK